jgi:hypothetical protein
MAVLAPPPSVDQDINSRQFRDWFYSIYALIGKPGSTLGTMAYENSNSVSITGGSVGGIGISGSTINSTPIGQTSAAAGSFTTLTAVVPVALTFGGTGASTASGARTNLGLGSGLSATITTAKLTTLGTNGSMTFTNGILTAQTQAT